MCPSQMKISATYKQKIRHHLKLKMMTVSSSRKVIQCCQQVCFLSVKSATHVRLNPCMTILVSIGTTVLFVAHTKGVLCIFKEWEENTP